MTDLALVTYCGLYCGLCSERGRLPEQARALQTLMVREGYEYFGAERPGFAEFWRFLESLCDPQENCPGCRAGGGPPFCGIRKCARARQVEICPLCEDYPCHRIDMLAEGYPTLIADGKRLLKVGLETWISEQVERSKTGFAYGDIRCHPYSIPEE